MRKLLSVLSSTLQGGVRGGLLFLLFFASVSAIYASDTQVDGIWYDFDSSTKTASVTYRGRSSYDYDGEYFGSVVIPSSVTYNGTTYSVTSIGYYAFSNCTSLTSVTIPESVTSIGKYAFSNCTSLTSVTIPESVTSIGEGAFYDCSSLTSVTIGESVTSIGDYAFNSCSSLTSVTINSNTIVSKDYSSGDNISHIFGSQVTEYIIGDDVKGIGSSAFYGCSSLTSITIPNSVTSIGWWAFRDCSSLTSITIPNSVTSIGEYAFLGCSSLTSVTINSDAIVNKAYSSNSKISHIFGSPLTSVTIPNSVTSIGDDAFSGCYSLTSVTIGESVTSIGDYAFSGCSSLTSVTIPNSVTSIGDYAFGSCSSLTKTNYTGDIAGWCNIKFGRYSANPMYYSHNFYINDQEIKDLVIPNSVTSIGDHAFISCSSLTSVTIPESVTSIGEFAFQGCSSLTSLTIPNSVTSIGDDAFNSCSALTSVTIPNSVTSIGEYAFYKCSSLASITIPNSVTSIGNRTFSYCSALTSITIPNSVTSIGGWAFDGCSSLNEVILGTGLKTIDEYAFQGCTKLYDVYCYAAEPPTTSESSFENYNAFLHVPCESQRLYLLDINFGNFKYIECVSSDEVSTDGVVVTPSTNDVTIIWPTETGADSYTIVIKKGDTVFCTLTFNANGQLLNIAFAPGRNGNHPAQYAEQAGNGYRFTVTGLEEGTHYAYNIDVRDAANKTIKSYTGEFTTESMTAVENTHSQSPIINYQKIIRDGQLYIYHNDKTYNTVGQIVE